ncbi:MULTISPECIES: TldD/PmbA family protein [unclassified Novosphingobium]|uniref:TldD/PmbA family protein n=1 Tax=unclassified Novosphingobium TaxID=2644732 RepID=UPI000D32379F|nr:MULTISPECIES: TldD/PmbA family protein [unclassified Novosphingobium]PTR11247.1 microcin-processing peptidase 1 [Novosphingobium sp. GV055]PUB04028.1 microcin-processing peptidase 1 [Novosphingobium sp. GV061]PUB20419.1 microcin-processing peptidase 1 [Novosphingobium sp. GV079]PUB42145.1 microcin-processing peptidase 1 [Novosphingobium sp. GV027]
MLTPAQAQERCHALIERARRTGAEAGDAVYLASGAESVSVRLGALEDVERSESEHIGLRVFVGGASASIGSTDLADAALDELASRAVAMARAAPADRFAGLADEHLLARGPFPDLDLDDPAEPAPQELRRLAEEAEDAARAVQGVTNSEGGSASTGRGVVALATSHGFSGAYAASSHSVSASVIAGEGGALQRDYAWASTRFAADLPPPAQIGREAGERAVARLNPGRVKSGAMPVVFDPRVGGSLVGHLLGAISGSSIARRSSFLLDHDGAQIFDSSVTITDDPLRRRGLRSRPFDGEGLPTAPRKLVDAGRLTGWLMDSAAARQLGAVPTGHASRGGSGAPHVTAGNVVIEPGTLTRAQLIADIADGVYVTELIGSGVNGVTGDYSRGAAGFRIVNGEIAGPIAEFTVAGNLLAMFAAMIPASDLKIERGIDVPTLRIDGMSVAGD